MDKQTLDILLKYLTAALEACSTWTHLGVLQALATVIYGNGQQCHQVPRLAHTPWTPPQLQLSICLFFFFF